MNRILRVSSKLTTTKTNKMFYTGSFNFVAEDVGEAKGSSRIKEFRKKLRETAPLKSLPEFQEGQHPYQEKEPLEPHPDNTNPNTGEVGGPKGPEPTRYGDWERKGRVSDF